MSNLKHTIWKQHTVSQVWGRFALAGSQIAIFFSVYTMVMVTVNAYAPISSWLAGFNIRLSFWAFLIILLIPIAIAYYLSWKLLVATFYRSSTDQFWAQSKEWTEKLEKIDSMDERLKMIEALLCKSDKK